MRSLSALLLVVLHMYHEWYSSKPEGETQGGKCSSKVLKNFSAILGNRLQTLLQCSSHRISRICQVFFAAQVGIFRMLSCVLDQIRSIFLHSGNIPTRFGSNKIPGGVYMARRRERGRRGRGGEEEGGKE